MYFSERYASVAQMSGGRVKLSQNDLICVSAVKRQKSSLP